MGRLAVEIEDREEQRRFIEPSKAKSMKSVEREKWLRSEDCWPMKRFVVSSTRKLRDRTRRKRRNSQFLVSALGNYFLGNLFAQSAALNFGNSLFQQSTLAALRTRGDLSMNNCSTDRAKEKARWTEKSSSESSMSDVQVEQSCSIYATPKFCSNWNFESNQIWNERIRPEKKRREEIFFRLFDRI